MKMINKTNRNILILEDSPTQAVELEYVLELNGYNPITAENGIKALEYLNKAESIIPDIIISDIVMPEMNGFDFCKKIKNNEKFKEIPIILLTSLANPSDVILGLECGADNFITKPYKREYLLSRIEYILINFQMRKHQASDLGVNIQFAGKKYYITSDRVQILDLLFSSFENAVQKNDELRDTIQKLNQTQKELLQTKNKLKKLATRDPLTGLYNRRAFKQIADNMLALTNRKKRKIAMLHLDVDNFKTINDTLGHSAGDLILKTIASKLTESLRNEDIIGRIGGDEFAVLLVDVNDIDEINIIVTKIINLFKKPVLIKEKKIFSTMSIGVSFSNENKVDTYKNLLKEADIAMYEAKKNGKGHFRLYDEHIKEKHNKQLSLEVELDRAIREKEFSMVYQPIIDFYNNDIVGIESLIRWNNKKLGTVGPNEFIPFAEKSKQIHDIGDWVINEVMRQCSVWSSELKGRFVTINLSTVQFERKSFIEVINSSIEKYKLNPKDIVLEITETAFTQSLNIETMKKLRKKEFVLAIDDFGSGYSSMQRLLELPVKFMKIDGETIKQFSDDKFKKIIDNILSIAKSLKLNTIAECVETKEQVDFLKKCGCDYAQGFYYHKPLNPDEIVKLLK